MKIEVAGEYKLNLFGLFGPGEASIESLLGDFHITEQTFSQSANYACRTTSASVTDWEVVGTPTSANTTLKMLNADASKLRFRERIELRNSDDEVVGYAVVESIVDADEPDDATHKNVLLGHSGIDGKFLTRALTTGDYLFLPEDTVLFDGEKTIGLDTSLYQCVFVNGTGTLQVSHVKKKV